MRRVDLLSISQKPKVAEPHLLQLLELRRILPILILPTARTVANSSWCFSLSNKLCWIRSQICFLERLRFVNRSNGI